MLHQEQARVKGRARRPNWEAKAAGATVARRARTVARDEYHGVWQPDMLARYPMDANAMVHDLLRDNDGERFGLVPWTYTLHHT